MIEGQNHERSDSGFDLGMTCDTFFEACLDSRRPEPVPRQEAKTHNLVFAEPSPHIVRKQ